LTNKNPVMPNQDFIARIFYQHLLKIKNPDFLFEPMLNDFQVCRRYKENAVLL